ncbi:head GIN domain-containing protein [Solitalea koreensis]|uniref:Auto-transporter adhesin, head GIN domain n=1 Tax=Solitalea koreensis TaxID=543615 RepID=A0A521CYF9_9SPHI|nr:head GIN domain-containing protein [Solitalea koreensis]SMO64486.1 Putative auto-transporter adhesin, head GIN domain [Solitalea koreensis]
MKIKKVFYSIIGLAIISIALFSFIPTAKQDAGNKRSVSGFNGISLGGPFKVFVKVGHTESLRIEADDDALKEISTEVKNSTLHIKQKENLKFWGQNKKANIYVTVKKLDNISVSGSGSLKVEDPIKTDKMELLVSGSGTISLPITAKEVGSAISGSGTIHVSGSAANSNIKISGSGTFKGLDLKTNKTTVTLSGSGGADVYADEELSATISGSGNVNYKGNAKTTNTTTSGSGKIKKIE